MLVPGVLALLPEYAGLVDPVAELRAACLDAVAWLGEAGPVTVVADPQGARVAANLLGESGRNRSIERRAIGSSPQGVPNPAIERLRARPDGEAAPGSCLVVANGTARRTEKAPGFLDERADVFDQRLGEALRAPDPAALTALDTHLAAELLVGNPDGLRELGARLAGSGPAVVDYDDDPFGVQYWVMRWQCES